MLKGKTESGFCFEVREDVMNDAELLEQMVGISSGDGTEVFEVMVKVLGAEQKKALYDHVRNEDGMVPLDKALEELNEIMKASKQGKN